MMPLLDSHLEQISASSNTIAELEFPPSKIFTNALLGDHEITNLIRDTDPHERALFSLDPNASRGANWNRDASLSSSFAPNRPGQGRQSVFPTAPSIKQSAVARVLGNDMLQQIRQSSGSAGKGKGSVNVEVLLVGAERLCEAYAVAGASDKITAIRTRHEHITSSIADYQERVLTQQSKLDRYHSGSGYGVDDAEDGMSRGSSVDTAPVYTEQDLEMEETEISELEARKKALEARVAGMEKDLGGLLQ